jgi:hypothetical protein
VPLCLFVPLCGYKIPDGADLDFLRLCGLIYRAWKNRGIDILTTAGTQVKAHAD